MKERGRKYSLQKEKDDAIMDFVTRQAQDAILYPNLPESYKDAALEAALEALLRIAEKRSAYITSSGENQGLNKSIRFTKGCEKEIDLPG